MNRIFTLVVASGALLTVGVAMAAESTYRFTATVTAATGDAGVGVGDQFMGTYKLKFCAFGGDSAARRGEFSMGLPR
jgi:uncharacterized protein involved in exopolysaccharide biosynthesis